MKTDNELKQDLMAQLKCKLGDRAKDIDVTIINSIVLLKGSVPSSTDRKVAETAVQCLKGVLAFADDITVQSPGNFQCVSMVR